MTSLATPSGSFWRVFWRCGPLCLASLALAGRLVEAVESPTTVEWLVEELERLDLADVLPHQSVYVLSSASECLHAMDRDPEAFRLLAAARRVALSDKPGSPIVRIAETAIVLERLDVVESLLDHATTMRPILEKRLWLARFRGGDDAALETYIERLPEVMSFHDAYAIALAYIDKGRFRAAEEFVLQVQITEENSPEDLIANTYLQLARKSRDAGDLESAKRWVDKAFAVGGNLYYTGFGVKVLHHSLHGTLKDNYKSLAEQAAAYRGHQGRELVQSLIRELIRRQFFEEAMEVVEFLPLESDVAS